MRYLVDTDWVIDYLHGREPVVSRLTFFAPQGIGLSIVSLAELYEGVFFFQRLGKTRRRFSAS